MKRILAGGVVAVAAVSIAACGATRPAPLQPVPTHSSVAAGSPVKACEQLLHLNTSDGNGISPQVSAQLLQESAGSVLGPDMKAYLTAVHATVPTTAAGAMGMLDKVVATARAVKDDCQAYGVNGLFHGAV